MLWILCTLIDLGVAVWVLFRPSGATRQDERITAARAWRAAIATAVAFVVKVLILRAKGLHLFGVIHLAYLDLVVALPLVGASVFLARFLPAGGRFPRRPTRSVKAASIAMLFLLPVGVYATYVEPFRLTLERASFRVSAERSGDGRLRIGIISDIQTNRVTAYEHRAVDRLMGESPDVILFPGDLFQGSSEAFIRQTPALRALLQKLSAPGGVYMVLGDVDEARQIESVLVGTQVRLLVNEIVRISVGDRTLTIGGIERAFDSEQARRTIAQLESAPGQDDIRILLAHYPDPILLLSPNTRVDLMAAGHTHGGQICLPLFGPPMIASHVPRHIGAGGLHQLDGRRIYVSRGVGCERGQAPRIRFLAPPEVAVVEILASKAN